MVELQSFRTLCYDKLIRLALLQDHMAVIARVGNDFSTCAFMLALVSTKATRTRKVPNIVRIGIPPDLHIGKAVAIVNLLQLRYRILDRTPVWCQKSVDSSFDRKREF